MYVERELEKELRKYLDRKEIIAVIGARQVGKTTLIKNILNKLKNVNIITLDDIEARQLFEEDTKNFIRLHVEPYDYLFIDEIQYSKNSGQRLKLIYDTTKTKILISGSSASEISIQSLKYLVGRVFIYHLHPFSFREYLKVKEKNLVPIYDKAEYGTNILERINKHLEEFIIYGGYPEVVLAKNDEEKEIVLKNIHTTYFLKEIKEILNLADDFKLAKLLKALALQIGNVIDYTELATLTELSAYEVKKYLNTLEKTFICKQIKNFHTNKRKELRKSPKIYFQDPGFRNIAIDNFSKQRTDTGALYEQFITNELEKKDIETKYWRTQSGAETDFIIEKQEKIIPIEVKTKINNTVIGKSLFSFIDHYKPEKAYVLSKNYTGKRTINKTKIEFLTIISVNNIKF